MVNPAKLIELAKQPLSISYHVAYLGRGRHEVVLGGGPEDNISVDGTTWTITGTALNKRLNLPINSICLIDGTPVEDMVVHLKAKAIVNGESLDVDLGERNVSKNKFEDDDAGILVLD